LYGAANIITVGSDIPTKKNWQVSKMVYDEIKEKIESGISHKLEILFYDIKNNSIIS